jgi:FAD/FMN-containing dehydrogenase
MAHSAVSALAVEALAASFSGRLIQPGDAGYDEVRTVWNGYFDPHPALVAQCMNAADVQAAVRFGRDNGLQIAVRGGGHSAQGYGSWDDALVIDTAPIKDIAIDTDARTVRAGAGLTWGEFDAATQEHGLAVTGGRFSSTGIAGLTLGSGSGWLERKCGLTADNLISADVVTADGDLLTASKDANADLFWGLRGGGGNFGIVSSFTYRLHQVGPIVLGGMMACASESGPATLRFLREYMVDAPDDLGLGAAFVSAPPEPFVPPEVQGAPMFGLIICWTGDHEEGERVLAPIREVAKPMMDMVQPIPYVALQSMLDGGGQHGTRAYMKAEFMPELSDEVIEKLAAHGASRPGPLVQLLLEPLGGAIARVPEGETALGRRDVPWCYHALSLWMDPSEETDAAHFAWAKALASDLAPNTTTGVYLNFTSDEGDERVRDMFGPERYAKLVALKDRYDPENVFRLNQNIKPSATA